MPRLPRNLVKRGETYYLRVRIRGKNVRRALGTDRCEAKQRAGRMLEDLRKKGAPDVGCETVRSFSAKWLSEYIRNKRNEKGQTLAAQRMRDHVLPTIGNVELAQVTSSDLHRLRGVLAGKHRSPQTVRHVLSDVRCLFGYAVECGVVRYPPSVRPVLPRIPERAPQRLSDADVDAILAATPEKYGLVIRLALLTGLRWGELHTLQWRHVAWQPDPHLILEGTKSGRVRRVPLVPEAAALLQRERARTSSVFVVPHRGKNPCSFVAAISRRIVQKEAMAGRAITFKWHFHQTRHTFACRWLDSGRSKEALQVVLGHSSIQMTERYGKMSDRPVFDEALRFGRESGHISGHTVSNK